MAKRAGIKAIVQLLLRDKRGVTALEYGLIGALVVVACLGAIQGFATNTVSIWTQMSSAISAAIS